MRGGARKGAGRPKQSLSTDKRRVQIVLHLHPDIYFPFKNKYGRKTRAKIEELMKNVLKSELGVDNQ